MNSTSDFDLLVQLVRLQDPQDPKSLSSLAEALEVSAPTLSRRLREFERREWVRRREKSTARGRLVFYSAQALFTVHWLSRHRHVGRRWELNAEVNWEFPLVSQVPDGRARETLVMYLRRLRRAGLLDMSPRGPAADRPSQGPLLVVYGSTARGDARPDADVDVLAFLDPEEEDQFAASMDGLAGEVSVEAPRPIQLDFASMEPPHDVSSPIWEAIRREGHIVYDGRRRDHRLWTQIYEGRELG